MIGRRPSLVLVPALSLALTGCGIDWSAEYDEDGNRIPEEPEYVAVCTDNTGQRVEDNRCDSAPQAYDTDGPGNLGFVWFYMATSGGHAAPPVGQRVSPQIGSYRAPIAAPGAKAPVVARGGSVPSTGGVVQRGGLGVSGAKAGGSGS